jgi:endoglucanase
MVAPIKFAAFITTAILLSTIAAICFPPEGMGRYLPAEEMGVRTCAYEQGGIIRGPRAKKKIALIFTGGDFADGGGLIRRVLVRKQIRANFFFTGDFFRVPVNKELITGLIADGHYIGPHSDKHLLYCSWENRDRLLVQKEEFTGDIADNFKVMEKFGVSRQEARYFIPPYEWYNRKIVSWVEEIGLILINFTPGTGSNADYTTPSMPEYMSSERIFNSILAYERSDPDGLNGFLLLLHIGTHPDREDRFYYRLEELIDRLRYLGYGFVRVDEMLADCSPQERTEYMAPSKPFSRMRQAFLPFFRSFASSLRSWPLRAR